MAWNKDDEERRDPDGGEADDEDEEMDENDFKTQKDAVIFAVDVSSSMMELPPPSESKKADRDSAMTAALKCAYKIMQQRIISQPKDMIGVLLFGTEKSRFREDAPSTNGTGYPHCYLLTDLDVPGAAEVKALRSLAEEGKDPEGILEPSKERVQMANVLFCANQIFTTNAANFGSRRLFIITDNDNPHAGEKELQERAAVRAKDLYDLGVTIELFPISRGDKAFELSKFYDDIIYRDPTEDPDASDRVRLSKSADGLSLLNSLISNINSKQSPKRSFFSSNKGRVTFEVAPGLTIGIKGYIILHRQEPSRSCYVYMEDEVPELATSETIKTEAATTRAVEKAEIKKAYKFGGEHVHFTTAELKELRDFGEPVLRIIGFKPRAMLPSWASVRKSLFLFPMEEYAVGSTRVFSALWQKLLKDGKFGLAWFKSRSNANPTLVAILPSKAQENDDSATSYLPAGLWVYPLPFADDLRQIDQRETPRAPNEIIDQMRVIVQNLQLPKAKYNPMKYPNPQLQWHYRILQAIALEDEVPDTPDDETKPKYKAINKRVGGYIAEWDQDVTNAATHLTEVRAIKRDAEGEEDGRPSKRAKPSANASKPSAQMGNAELKKAVKNDTLKKLTVGELKEILTGKGLETGGKKADLLDRLEQWIEENA